MNDGLFLELNAEEHGPVHDDDAIRLRSEILGQALLKAGDLDVLATGLDGVHSRAEISIAANEDGGVVPIEVSPFEHVDGQGNIDALLRIRVTV